MRLIYDYSKRYHYGTAYGFIPDLLLGPLGIRDGPLGIRDGPPGISTTATDK